jgi:hypothetical protein
VNGKNHIRGPALRKACPAGLDEHLRAEHMKRARIKLLVKFGCHVTSIHGGHLRSLPWSDGRAASLPEVAPFTRSGHAPMRADEPEETR